MTKEKINKQFINKCNSSANPCGFDEYKKSFFCLKTYRCYVQRTIIALYFVDIRGKNNI